MLLREWLNTEEGEFWEEKAHQSADDGDGHFDDIIANLFWQHCENPKDNPKPAYEKVPSNYTCNVIKKIVAINTKLEEDNDIDSFFTDVEAVMDEESEELETFTVARVDEWVKQGLITYREAFIFMTAMDTFTMM